MDENESYTKRPLNFFRKGQNISPIPDLGVSENRVLANIPIEMPLKMGYTRFSDIPTMMLSNCDRKPRHRQTPWLQLQTFSLSTFGSIFGSFLMNFQDTHPVSPNQQQQNTCEILTENPKVPAAFWPVDRLLHPTNCAFGYLLQTSVLDEAVFWGGNPLHV